MEDDQEDWLESSDDKDGGYWEDYLGGPDDDEIERQERDLIDSDYD